MLSVHLITRRSLISVLTSKGRSGLRTSLVHVPPSTRKDSEAWQRELATSITAPSRPGPSPVAQGTSPHCWAKEEGICCQSDVSGVGPQAGPLLSALSMHFTGGSVRSPFYSCTGPSIHRPHPAQMDRWAVSHEVQPVMSWPTCPPAGHWAPRLQPRGLLSLHNQTSARCGSGSSHCGQGAGEEGMCHEDVGSTIQKPLLPGSGEAVLPHPVRLTP